MANGGNPYAGVMLGPEAILYGTTAFGGTAGLGVVFKLDTSGKETVLHTFLRGPHENQPDLAGVILDSVGDLYGTTAFGGAGGQGVVYKFDTSGNETVLYAFPGATDGQYPYNAGVIFGSDCHLYETTALGGKTGGGVVYQLDGECTQGFTYFFFLHGHGLLQLVVLFLLFLRHRFRHKFRHGVFSFTKKFSKPDQRASRTIAIKAKCNGTKQCDNGIDDTFVSSVGEEVSFALIDFRD